MTEIVYCLSHILDAIEAERSESGVYPRYAILFATREAAQDCAKWECELDGITGGVDWVWNAENTAAIGSVGGSLAFAIKTIKLADNFREYVKHITKKPKPVVYVKGEVGA